MQKKIPTELGTNILGYFSFLFFPWLLTILVGKMYGAELLGEVSLAISIVTPVFVFFSLQLRNRIASDINLRPDKSSFLSWRIVTSLSAIIPIFVLGITFFGNEISLVMLLIITSWRLVENLADMVYGFLQRGNHLGYIGTSQIFKYVPACLILLGLSLYGLKLETTLSISIIPLLFIFIIFDLRNFNSLQAPEENITPTKEYFLSSLPLGLSASVSALVINIPRYFLGSQYGKVEVGHFTASFVIYSLVLMGINFLLQLYLGKLKERYEKEPASFPKFSFQVILSCLLISTFFYLLMKYFSGDILRIIYGEIFEDYQGFLKAFSYLAFISYPLTGISYLLLAKQNIKVQLPASIISLIGTLLGLYLFRFFNEYSVFWALGLGQLLQLSIYCWDLKEKNGDN